MNLLFCLAAQLDCWHEVNTFVSGIDTEGSGGSVNRDPEVPSGSAQKLAYCKQT